MTVAATQFPLVGTQPVGNYFTPDTTQRQPLGSILNVVDPYWGGGQFVYLQAGAATLAGQAVFWNNAGVATLLPNAANQGFPVAFAQTAMAVNTYGWYQITGNVPAYSNATVAAGAQIGIAAVGALGANSAGKEILGVRVSAPATTTVVKTNCVTLTGSNIVRTQSNTDGWFVGMPISGTGIPASTTVTSIGSDNRTITISNNSTSSGAVALTGTYNDGTNFWNVLTVNTPLCQGAIT